MDKEQFIEVLKRHKNLIYKICHAYCLNAADHKDLEQEIVLQLWQSMSRFNGSVQLTTWMYRIALNTAISFYRKERRYRRISGEAVLLVYDEVYDPQIDEQINKLHSFITQLNNLDRALMLLYLDNVLYREIAQVLGISESNVATKISRIKNRLKSFLKQ